MKTKRNTTHQPYPMLRFKSREIFVQNHGINVVKQKKKKEEKTINIFMLSDLSISHGGYI